MSCSQIDSGTRKYMSMYPKESTDAVIRLGNLVPDFSCDTTQGRVGSFHGWKRGKWAVLCSHPADFTPVCTTEIASMAEKHQQFRKMNCLVTTLSVDSLNDHYKWMEDVVAHNESKDISIDFPIIADPDRSIASAYGMIDTWHSDRAGLPLTIRSVFIIDPDNRLMTNLNYPASVGRNINEIIRCVKALQLSYEKSIATPANWPKNHRKLTLENGTVTDEYKGAVFILPSVSKEDAEQFYPGYHTCAVPSKKPYLRLARLNDVDEFALGTKPGRSRVTRGIKKELSNKLKKNGKGFLSRLTRVTRGSSTDTHDTIPTDHDLD